MDSILESILDNGPCAVVLYNYYDRKILYQNQSASKFMQLCDAYDILSTDHLDASFLSYIEKQDSSPFQINIHKDKSYSFEIIKKDIDDNKHIFYIFNATDYNDKINFLNAKIDALKELIQKSPSAICLFEWDGITIRPKVIGESLVKILGYPDDVLRTKNFNDFIKLLHSEDIFKFTTDVKNALYETHFLKSIYRIYNKPMNTYRHVHIEAVFVSQPNGHMYINCSFTDIHEEREKSKALQAANHEIKLLYEHIPGAIFTFKFNKYYSLLYANEEFYSFLGYNSASFKKLCNNRVSEIILDEDKEHFAELIRSRYSTQSTHHITLELRLKTANGTLKWFSLSGQVMEDNDGSPYCYFVFLDIDEYKKVQLQQKKEIDTIQSLLDTIKKGIIRFDDKYNIVFSNYYAIHALGYNNSDELMSKKDIRLLFSDKESLNKLIECDGHDFTKIRLISKDDSTFDANAYLVSNKANDGTNILLFTN